MLSRRSLFAGIIGALAAPAVVKAESLMRLGRTVSKPRWFSPDFVHLDGSVLKRAEVPDLFALYGIRYGDGNGYDTFGLPAVDGYVTAVRPVPLCEYQSDVQGYGFVNSHLDLRRPTFGMSEYIVNDHLIEVGSGVSLQSQFLADTVGSRAERQRILDARQSISPAGYRAQMPWIDGSLPNVRHAERLLKRASRAANAAAL